VVIVIVLIVFKLSYYFFVNLVVFSKVWRGYLGCDLGVFRGAILGNSDTGTCMNAAMRAFVHWLCFDGFT
jgi:hypothetical protein